MTKIFFYLHFSSEKDLQDYVPNTKQSREIHSEADRVENELLISVFKNH